MKKIIKISLSILGVIVLGISIMMFILMNGMDKA